MMYVVTVIAALVSNIIGFAWFSPSTFGGLYKSLLPQAISPMQSGLSNKRKLVLFASNFVLDVLTAFALVIVLFAFGSLISVWFSILTALIMWIGFILPILIGGVLWEGKSPQLLLLTGGYRLLSLIAMSLVIYYGAHMMF